MCADLKVNDQLLGGGEGGELSGRPHADPGYGSTGASPQTQNAVLPVDGCQSVDHPLAGRGETREGKPRIPDPPSSPVCVCVTWCLY